MSFIILVSLLYCKDCYIIKVEMYLIYGPTGRGNKFIYLPPPPKEKLLGEERHMWRGLS